MVDAFVRAVGAGELGDVLQRLFQTSHDPTPTHAAIARLAAAGHFTAVVTTNYDDLLERALAAAGVRVVVQTLENNAAVREQDGALRLYKIHGSITAWQDVVLSGQSYADFDARYEFLRDQLNVLLQTYPLLFTGCSLQDPRVLEWLESRPANWLKRWRALMQPAAWTAAQGMLWKGGTAGAVLGRAPLRPIEYQNHADLPPMWIELAKKLAPLAVNELVFDLHPGDDEWRTVGPTPESAPHTAPNPRAVVPGPDGGAAGLRRAAAGRHRRAAGAGGDAGHAAPREAAARPGVGRGLARGRVHGRAAPQSTVSNSLPAPPHESHAVAPSGRRGCIWLSSGNFRDAWISA